MGGLLSKLLDKLFSKNLDVVLVGLNNSGKTTFCETMKLGINPKIQVLFINYIIDKMIYR